MILDNKNIVRLAAYELKSLLLGTLNKGKLIWAGSIVHSLILIYNNCMADS